MSNFGKNIKKIRSVRGLSQQAFAELFELKRATLGAYEEGRSEPKIETIIKVANHFSISTDLLLTGNLTVNQLMRFKDDMEAVIDRSAREVFEPIPCITPRCVRDFIQFYADKPEKDQAFLNDLPQVILPVEDTSRLIGIVMDSLEMSSLDEGLFPGDMIVCRETTINSDVNDNSDLPKIKESFEVAGIREGDMVMVLTSDRLWVRRVAEIGEELILVADHINVPKVIVATSTIVKLYKVVHNFVLRPPIISRNLEKRLVDLEKRMEAGS
jgi:transcriptional regulator with XRE-family HTH domain